MSYDDIRNRIPNCIRNPHYARLEGELISVRIRGFDDTNRTIRVSRFDGTVLHVTADNVSAIWPATV